MKMFAILISVLMCFYLSQPLRGEDIKPEDLPSMIGASNSGTLFYLTFHPSWETNSKGNALRIYIASLYATTVTLEIEGLGIFKQKMTIPNGVIEFLLTPSEGQPYTKSDRNEPLPEQIWEGRAIKITSDDPIICYGVTRFYATSDGYMALPVDVLGMNYQVASYADPTTNQGQWLPSYTSIVGVYDNTHVKFKLGGCESCFALKEDGSKLTTGQSISKTINEGDVWLIPGIGPFNDLTGSNINADKPVGVISGNFCAYIPTQIAACDFIIEQEFPTENWGTKYLVAPIRTRKNYSIIKIFAKEPNTIIKRNGQYLGKINTPGGILGQGYLEVRADSVLAGDPLIKPVVISSDQPINVVLYNTGSQDDGIENDPFQMQILAQEQFQTDVMFNTPGIKGQYGFKNNFLNLIYKATPEGKIPDDLMFGVMVGESIKWVKMYEYSGDPGLKFYSKENEERAYYAKIMILPEDGVYRLKANDPFAAYAYGSDYYDSYGFPAAGRLMDLTTDETIPPVVEFNMGNDGTITGKAEDVGSLPGLIEKDGEMVQAVTEASGLSVVSLIHSLSYNYKLTCDNFIPGIENNVNFKIELKNKDLSAKAVLVVSDRRGNDTVLVFKKDADALPTIAGTVKNFGILKSSKEASLDFVLENNFNTKTVPLKMLVLESNDPQFEIVNNLTANTILQEGEKHSFSVKFISKALNSGAISEIEGKFANRIGFELVNGEKYFFDVIEAEVANPHIEVTDVTFPTKMLDEKYKQEFIYIYNKGKMPLEISGFEFSEGSPFILTIPDVSLDNPLIINPGKEYFLRTNFEPKEPGEFTASLKVISDGYEIKNEAKITGTAIPVTSVTDDELSGLKLTIRFGNGILNFSSDPELSVSSIEIYDLSGRLMAGQNSTVNLNNYSLRIPEITSGVYIVKLKINNVWISRKVVI
ncbi:MAG: T9SS type A sorting domain-containing protein [Candidatus Kapabacteria bacterium]|nr:T9SS type A sorting domain-containing protein [Candidatus Kapabacteria bacterium]